MDCPQIVAENGNKLLPETATLSQHLSKSRFWQQLVSVCGNFVALCGQALRGVLPSGKLRFQNSI